ncbi:MAG TPA: hypothetical protein VIH98_16360, partial [Xanthobacteraceae bacterium]
SVLRSLGYRMEKRPKPVEPSTCAPASDASPPSEEMVAAAGAATQAEAQLVPMIEIEPGAPSDEPAGEVTAPFDLPPQESTEVSPSPAMEAVVEVPEAPALAVSEQADLLGPEVPLQEAIPAIAASGEQATTDFIDVWRPGRRDDNKSSQRSSRRHRTQPSSTARAVAAHLPSTAELGATAEQAEHSTSPDLGAAAEQAQQSTSPDPAPPDRRDQPPRGPGRRRRHEREKEAGEQPGPDRADRRRHDMTAARRASRPQASQRANRPDRPARADRPDRDPALRAKYIKTRAEAGALRDPDPDSPFAKLAKLKEQLEANAKEPR